MIAIEHVRRDPETIRRAMQSRGEPDPVDELLELDAAWRRDRTQADEIRNRRNQVNREIGHARSAGQPPAPEVIEGDARAGPPGGRGWRPEPRNRRGPDARYAAGPAQPAAGRCPGGRRFRGQPHLPTRKANPPTWASRACPIGSWASGWAS